MIKEEEEICYSRAMQAKPTRLILVDDIVSIASH